MHVNNLVTAGKYFAVITGELVLLFIVISFLVGLIQQLVPDETMKRILGKPHLPSSPGRGLCSNRFHYRGNDGIRPQCSLVASLVRVKKHIPQDRHRSRPNHIQVGC